MAQPSTGGIIKAQGAAMATNATPHAMAVLHSSTGGRKSASSALSFFIAHPTLMGCWGSW